MCCKANKWWPHNWLCLKGLYIVFVVLFYIALAFTLYGLIDILVHAKNFPSAYVLWATLLNWLLPSLGTLLALLAVSKILNVLRKIKKAVAPCCCEAEEAKEEVVAVVTEEK